MIQQSPPRGPSPQRNTESILQLLRQEWKNGFDGRAAAEAAQKLRQLQAPLVDSPASIPLARIETQMNDYANLPQDRKPGELKQIADQLKRLDLPSLSPAASPYVQPGSGGKRRKLPQLPLDANVKSLPRVGPSVAGKLSKLGLRTVGDVVRDIPKRHIDYSNTVSIQDAVGFGRKGEVTVRGRVDDITTYPGPPARVTIKLRDASGTLRVTWFNPYISKQLSIGDEIAISGEIERGYGVPGATSPEWEKLGGQALSTGRLTPVYGLTQGIAQKTLRTLTRNALDSTATTLEDFLPADIITRAELMPLRAALEQAHFPDSYESLKRSQRRLSFDELFLLQLGLVRLKNRRESVAGIAFAFDQALIDEFVNSLPFRLTAAQERVMAEVLTDISQPTPMSRLLQGDVGSGKTVVAAVATLASISSGYQVALMAPTEILAGQHAENLNQLFGSLPPENRPSVSLLTGSTRKKARESILAQFQAGESDLLVGTHALIQDQVDFQRLGLVVVDEQHRFGVRQRSELLAKSDGSMPHLLSMSATPIPRSLSMVLSGDSDVSVIDELPPGRIPIETRRYTPETRSEAYELVRTQIANGRQTFVICPLVEESDAIDAKAAIAEAQRLQEQVFPELKVEVLHGRMSGKEKTRIMDGFRDRNADILVATSVIEVGIDIPNATIMLVEGADRFGLAQLHQFRGRVGRAGHRSYCLLIAEEASLSAEQRLQMMVQTTDGFALAEKDLELRGPGDFVGTRQSGLPEMRAFSQGFDSRVLDIARRSAATLLEQDPELSAPEHERLQARLVEYWANAAPDLAFT